MRVLLDENVPRYLRRELTTHDVSTVTQNGWSGITNGVLLGLAAGAGFDVFLTCDRNIEHQQNIPVLGLAIVLLAVPIIERETILPLAPEILVLLDGTLQPGTLTVIGTWHVS